MHRSISFQASGQHMVRTLVREAVGEGVLDRFEAQLIELFQSFRERRQSIALVLDEFGGAEGIVTLEDIMEQVRFVVRKATSQSIEGVLVKP